MYIFTLTYMVQQFDDIGELVRDLDFARARFSTWIDEYNSGVFPSVNLSPFFPDPFTVKKFHWYAHKMRWAQNRKNKDPYFIHPALVGYLVQQIVPVSQIEIPQIVAIGFGHDWVENGLHYDHRFFMKHKQLFPAHAAEFDSIVLLSSPEPKDFHSMNIHDLYEQYLAKKIAPSISIKLFGGMKETYVRLCDNACNILDTSYLYSRPIAAEKIAGSFIAPLKFSMDQFLIDTSFKGILNKIIEYACDKHSIHPSEVKQYTDMYFEFSHKHGAQVEGAIRSLLGRFDVTKRSNGATKLGSSL